MKPPVILLFLAHSLLVATPSADRRCRNDEIPCPQTSSRWALYEDSNPGAPDFWWKTDPLAIRDISLCDHGIHFVFEAMHGGRLRTTALVFPKPSRSMLSERLGLAPDGDTLEKELAHFEGRYASLLAELARVSGGTLVEGAHERFAVARDGEAPTLVIGRLLALRWRGEELKLRGYLDVYFLEPRGRTVAAARNGSLDPPAARTLSLSVVPNPGRGAAYAVAYAVPSAGPVTVEVFDVAGRRVATLVRGTEDAGSRRLAWDARASGGHRIAPGLYFARLTTAAGSRTAKFVHLGG